MIIIYPAILLWLHVSLGYGTVPARKLLFVVAGKPFTRSAGFINNTANQCILRGNHAAISNINNHNRYNF